jgi:hypothetical protein
MAYEGTRVATISQSSIAKRALTFRRASNLKQTDKVWKTPQMIPARMTESPLGFVDMLAPRNECDMRKK